MRKKVSLLVFSFLIAYGAVAQRETLLPISAIKSSEDFLLIPETREHPVQFNDSVRKSWVDYSADKLFSVPVKQNEFYVFQIVAIALEEDVKTLQVKFHPLKGLRQQVDAKAFTCFNTEGIDYKGKPFTKNVSIAKGKLQPLWIGVQLNGRNELYSSEIEVIFNGKVSKKLPVEFRMQEGTIYLDGGVSNTNTLSKLKWLNNTLGINNEITQGYTPIARNNNTLRIVGREIELGDNGLPKQVKSYFTGANDILSDKAQNLLASPFAFKIILKNGQELKLQKEKMTFLDQNQSAVQWQCVSESPEITLICNAVTEFDGYSKYNMKVIGKRAVEINDIRLEFAMPDKKAEYSMGMNLKGGYRPQNLDWKWNVAKMNQDAIWLGNMNGGIRLKLMDEQYVTPLINIYYEFGPLKLPASWGNGEKGGFKFTTEKGVVKALAYSGSRKIQAKDTLNYDFELLVTPVKRFDKEKLFADRYSHPRVNFSQMQECIEDVKKVGANIVNVHHAKEIYPYINYPFNAINIDSLETFVKMGHEAGLRVKPYYTTREITVNLPEFWTFRSLDGEVLFPGPGNTTKTVLHDKPDQWMIDNLRDNYIQAWVATFKGGRFEGHRDLSVLTTPDSRLNNFYIGGLDWMCKNMHIDGVYIDDCALERTTIRRARKIIDQYRPAGRMDLHSWNHFCPEGSWANCLNLYMDMLPYFDLLWIGEGRDYDEMPDHWLVEICGIPYGVCSQMLDGGGNPWRGMVYEITNRAFWAKQGPEHIWKFWDRYNIQSKDFVGYWDARNPISTNSDSVKVTLYKGKNESIISIASWAKSDISVSMNIDWKALGMNPEKVKIHAPAIENFQEAKTFYPNKPIDIQKGKGYLLVFENKE